MLHIMLVAFFIAVYDVFAAVAFNGAVVVAASICGGS
jgi:hypothetical protein